MTQPPNQQRPAPEGHQSASQNPGDVNPGPQSGLPQPEGQYPGSQYPAEQYPGYQSAPQPPSGYGVAAGMPPPPPGWGTHPPQQPVARPTTVTYALLALVVNVGIGALAAILVFANQDAYFDQAFRDAGLDPSSGFSSDLVSDTYTIVAVIGLIFVALWGLFLWFAWKGHNWARIVIWVFGGLALISAFSAFSSPVGFIVVLNVVSLLLTLAALVLLALKPSNEWYSYQGKARRYGWPGRA